MTAHLCTKPQTPSTQTPSTVWHRPFNLPATLTWLLCALWLLSFNANAFSQTASAKSFKTQRTLKIGDNQIHCTLPEWAPERPFEYLKSLVERGQIAQARSLLIGLAVSVQQGLLTTESIEAGRESSLRITAPADTLHSWLSALAQEFPQHMPALLRDPDPQTHRLLWPSHPQFWLGNPKDEKNITKLMPLAESYFESGQWAKLERLLESPLGKELQLESKLSSRPAPYRGIKSKLFKSTLPSQSDSSLQGQQLHKLELIYRADLNKIARVAPRRDIELEALPANHQKSLAVQLGKRRMPFAAIYPLLSKNQIIMEVGSRLFCIEFASSPRLIWQFDSKDLETKATSSLLLSPSIPWIAEDILFVPMRSAMPQRPNEIWQKTATGKIDPIAGMHKLRLLKIADNGNSATRWDSELARLIEAQLDQWSIVAHPVMDGEQIAILAARGYKRIQLKLFVFSRHQKKLAWSQDVVTHLSSYFAASSLVDKIPQARLIQMNQSYLVISGKGIAARFGREQGAYLGVLGYPRKDFEDHPKSPSGLRLPFWGAHTHYMAEALTRYPGPVIRNESGKNSQLICLPADSRRLLCLDVSNWNWQWQSSHEIPLTAMLLGEYAKQIWILDCGIPAASKKMRLYAYETARGELNYQYALELKAVVKIKYPTDKKNKKLGFSNRAIAEVKAGESLLVGVPRLVGQQLWIPTSIGIEQFQLDQLDSRENNPSYVCAWPKGAQGGSAFGISATHVLSIGRASLVPWYDHKERHLERVQSRSSTLEIFKIKD